MNATAQPEPAGAGLIGEVLECLGQETPVRCELPGGGRVHIDRPLPFLCLHAIGNGHHLAALDVVTANAAYVIAPELAVAAWDGDDPLTERERDVLRNAADGSPIAVIAERLHLAEGTVRNYLSSAIAKIGARNRIEAATTARERGWL